ncbi:hypothetical protein OROGR_032383 [Orobanche gracilis]
MEKEKFAFYAHSGVSISDAHSGVSISGDSLRYD